MYARTSYLRVNNWMNRSFLQEFDALLMNCPIIIYVAGYVGIPVSIRDKKVKVKVMIYSVHCSTFTMGEKYEW